MLHAFYQKHTKHINISPGDTAEPPFTIKTIVHQTGPRILLSVTHMLYVNQVCYDVDRCVKDGSCSSSSRIETQWTVLMAYLTISTNVRRYQTHDIFFFQEDSAHAIVCNTIQLSEIYM